MLLIATLLMQMPIAPPPLPVAPPMIGLTAVLTLPKHEYRGREEVVATLRLTNTNARPLHVPASFAIIEERDAKGEPVLYPGEFDTYSVGSPNLQMQTLRAGESFEQSLDLHSLQVVEDAVSASATVRVRVPLTSTKMREVRSNVVRWQTIGNDRATFNVDGLGDDQPLYVTLGEVDERMQLPVPLQPPDNAARSEAERAAQKLASFDDTAPAMLAPSNPFLDYEVGPPLHEYPHFPVAPFPFLPLEAGTASGLAPNPYISSYQNGMPPPPYPLEVGLRQVIAGVGTGTAHPHRVWPSTPYDRSYDEALDTGSLNRYVPPPIRFEIESDRTMIETVATAPRTLADRLGIDAVDLSYTFATERARRIASMVNTTIHGTALVVPFGPAPRGQTIAVAMTVGRAAFIGKSEAAPEPTPTPDPDSPYDRVANPTRGTAIRIRKPDYDRIDLPDSATSVSGEARKAALAPADGVFLQLRFRDGNGLKTLDNGTIASLVKVVNAIPAIDRYRIDQRIGTTPATLTMALKTTDPERIRLVIRMVESGVPELRTTNDGGTYFSSRCARLDDEAIGSSLAVARANAEQTAGTRRLRKLVVVYAAPAEFTGGTCSGPLPSVEERSTGPLEIVASPRITAKVRVRVLYRTSAP